MHLGLGHFFRAHQAWYSDHAPDAGGWGIAAFSGRHGGPLVDGLAAQGGLYTLVTRGADVDRFEVVTSVARVHAGTDHAAWLGYLTDRDVAVVTTTVTEAGYCRDRRGGLDRGRRDVGADVAALRADPTAAVRSAPAKILAGLLGRRRADAGPLAVVPCDNLAANGAVVERVVREMASLVAPDLSAWMDASVSFVTTVVDRITPRPVAADGVGVTEATGVDDRCPVVTEPFAEWVLAGGFPAGRPDWEGAGAVVTGDATPFEDRKLWLLNGGHSLLAYAGSLRGHETVADAVVDDVCRSWLEDWWDEASAHLDQPTAEITAYRGALVDRFANRRIRHLLAQIAADGSEKLAVRVVPVLRAERAAGRLPAGSIRIVAAWIAHLRGAGAPVRDVAAERVVALAGRPPREAARGVLGLLDPSSADDTELVDAVVAAGT